MNLHQSEQEFHDWILRTDPESFLHRCLLTLNPGAAYLPNWHIQAIAYHLRLVWEGKITRLIINMPPRYLKSLTVSVAWPAYVLGLDPTGGFLRSATATSCPLSIRQTSDPLWRALVSASISRNDPPS